MTELGFLVGVEATLLVVREAMDKLRAASDADPSTLDGTAKARTERLEARIKELEA